LKFLPKTCIIFSPPNACNMHMSEGVSLCHYACLYNTKWLKCY
jgi:hypothetical protein